MLKITPDIRNIDYSNLSDNVLHYDYDIKHLNTLTKLKTDEESPEFLSSYRSFEGEVYENFIYEKLVRYAAKNDEITQFLITGKHTKNTKAVPKTLSVNAKAQIVYRTRSNEIGEFDALFFTKEALFFTEITLVKSVANLKKRLRKKRALLKTIFPQFEIKALIILNDGVMGARNLPDYCTVWLTKPFSASNILEWIRSDEKKKLKPFEIIKSNKFVGTEKLEITPFNYYGSMSWMLKNLRRKKHQVINMSFLRSELPNRYLELFTKIYLGWVSFDNFKTLVPDIEIKPVEWVYVSIEKEHTGDLILSYFLSHSRKNLQYITIKEGVAKVAKKDPYGITVTEIHHMSKAMTFEHELNIKQINTVLKIFENNNNKDEV
jgi:hypothetical protein